MRKQGVLARCAVVSVGALALVSVAGAAFAEESYGDDAIDVDVNVEALPVPGVLAMSVAGTSVTLTEDGSTGTVRQFTGELPTVTVTDTRTADEIPDGAYWYVLGSATDFVGDAGQDPITAGHLGWAPSLIDGGDSGLVSSGEQVDTVLDSGDDAVGLVDQELLAMAFDSEAIAEEGSWTAAAELFLKTPITVAPGGYASVLTLSLFE